MKIPPGYGHKPRLTPQLTREQAIDTFSIEEVGRLCGVGRETVRRYAVQLGVGRRTLGTRWAFTADEVEQLRQVMPGKPGRPRSTGE